MGPTINEVHINRPLTEMMVKYMQDQGAFIADQVFPMCPVQFRSNKYFKVPKDAWFKAGAVERAPGTESAGINYHLTTDDYVAKVIAAHFDLDDQTRANIDSVLQNDLMAMQFVAQNLLISREREFLATFLQPGVWSGANATGATVNQDYDVIGNGAGSWGDPLGDPIKDIRAAQTYVEGKTGLEPRTLTVTKDVHNALINNRSIIERIKYTQRGVLTEDLLASMLNVDKYLVAKAVLNTAQTGREAEMGYMASNGALLSFATPTPSLNSASAGMIFPWVGYLGAGAYGNVMSQIPMPWLKSTRYEGEMAYAMKLVAPDLGVYFTNILPA